jgi:hypothetical protein
METNFCSIINSKIWNCYARKIFREEGEMLTFRRQTVHHATAIVGAAPSQRWSARTLTRIGLFISREEEPEKY